MKHIKPLFAATSVMAILAGCGDNQRIGQFWGQEAGALIDEGYFGAPTAHNTGVHNGSISVVDTLALRFSQEVGDTVNFAFNSAVLDDNARAVLRQQAVWINQFPELRFRIYGHTDLVGGASYNKRLGMRRAQAVVRYLSSLGVSRSRLEAVVSHGETQPVVQTENQELRNRRTVTEVSGFIPRHPTVMSGKYGAIVHRTYVESAEPVTDLTQGNVSTVVE